MWPSFKRISNVMWILFLGGPLPDVKAERRYQLTKIEMFSEEPGFYEGKGFGENKPVQISEASLAPQFFDSVLVLKFHCSDGNFPIQSLSLKNLKWSLKVKSATAEILNGEVQTDKKGFARLRISSLGSLRDSEILFDDKYAVTFGSGPYQFEVPICD